MASGPNQAAAALRELADDELAVKLRESKEELFNLRFQSATGQLDNNRRLRVVRHEIARIYTTLRERELGIAPAFTLQPDNADPDNAADAKLKAESRPGDEPKKDEVEA